MSSTKTATGANKILPLVGLAIAVIALVISGMLVCKHEGVCTGSMGCTIGDVDGCSELGKSSYSKLFGVVHIAWLGFFYYAFMAVTFLLLFLRADDRDNRPAALTLLMAAAVFGFVFDLFLAYTNFMVLVVPCVLCGYTYICQLGVLIVAALLYVGGTKDGSGGKLADLSKGGVALWPSLTGGVVSILALMVILSLIAGGGSANGREDPDNFLANVAPDNVHNQRLRELRAFKTVDLDTRGLDNYVGTETAFISIHEWADFRCPHCLHTHEMIRAAQLRWPGRIKVYYRHFPLDGACNPLMAQPRGGFSCNGAQAALCAPQQNIFDGVYHGIFEYQNTRTNITPAELQKLVEGLGGDWSRMVSCMGSPATVQKLNRDIKEAEALDIQSTPQVVLNGHVLPPGTPNPQFFFAVVDALVVEKEGAAAVEDFNSRKQGGR